MTRIVLAFSGGLDTSFCAAWLQREHGAEVVSVCVDTGGFSAEALAAVEARAHELGVVEHRNVDGRAVVCDRFLAYVVKGQALRGGVYPVSVAAERTAQTEAVVAVAREVGADAIAHGSTGAGNDQIRFDVALAALAPDLAVIAPVRALGWSRQESADWLTSHGIPVSSATVAYSVNSGLVGTTIGGVETHDSWSMPPESVYSVTVAPSAAPDQAETLVVGFQAGVATSLDGRVLPAHELLAELNARAGAHGYGRGIHVGDTILGVKGRIAFEAPGPLALVTAHRELSKLVLTKRQAHWLRAAGEFWGETLHEGLYHDPAMRDVEALLDSINTHVTGEVKLRLHQGRLDVVGVRSPHSLLALQSAVYGERTGAWTGADAAGFAAIHGNTVRLAGERDRRADSASTPGAAAPSSPAVGQAPGQPVAPTRQSADGSAGTSNASSEGSPS